MKKIFLFIALCIPLLFSCSNNNGTNPVISVDSIYVDGKKIIDISQAFPEGKDVEVFTTLSAVKGGTLSAFSVTMECGDDCPVTDVKYSVTDVTKSGLDIGLSDYTIRFVDGIVKTKVSVKSYLLPDDNDQFKLNFYLSTDDTEAEAAKQEITFHVSREK